MKVIVKGHLVNYKDEGSGKVMLLLHGWGQTLQTFDDLASHFSKNYRVIRIDFPGFGGSPKPSDDWHIDDYAKFVADFLQKVEVDKVYGVLAHSFGGRVTIKSAAKKYFAIEKLVLMGSAGVKPSASAKKMAYKLIAKAGKQITKMPGLSKAQVLLRRKLYASAGATDYLESADLKQIFLHTINEDLQGNAATIKQPALLVWGQDDNQTPVADAQKLHGAMKNSQLVIFPNAGHFIYIDERDAVVQKLDEFLA